MKKVLSIVTVLLLCLSLAIPAFAAQDVKGFVPSIEYKPTPEFVPVYDEDGNVVYDENGEAYIGVIKDANGEVIDFVDLSCLVVTPVAHVWDDGIEVDPDTESLILFLYNSLNDGSMEIPYDKHNADLDPDNMVIRDLLDARWACEEHPKMLEPEGVVLELTFDLGVVAEAEIYVQTYDEQTGEWSPIVSAVNNGDGTVTCVFEHLCGVEFSMPMTIGSTGEEVNDGIGVLPWIIVLAVAAAAAVVVLTKKKKTAA